MINKIREERKKLALTSRQLAKMINVQENIILAYERNQIKASRTTIEKICIATKTNICDWVDDEYFSKKDNCNKEKKVSFEKSNSIKRGETKEELITNFFTSLSRADNTMDILYNSLIEMKEITSEDGNVIISEFAESLILSVVNIKYQIVRDKLKSEPTGICIDIRKTFDKYERLTEEMKFLLGEYESLDLIIKALNDINYIDKEGNINIKARKLIEKIVLNKVNDTVKK